MSALEARSSKTARKTVEEGASQPITFSFKNDSSEEIIAAVDLPEESFVNVLHFLDGHELVDASLVSKVWLSSTRLPTVWKDGVDMSRGMNTKELNMTGLLKLLRRPQFSQLKAIALPSKVKLGASGVKQMAKALPHLETIDLGYYSGNTKAKDSDLLAVAEHLTHLNGLRTDMWNVTSYGIASLARAMGSQLVDLRVKADTIMNNYMSQAAMETIASSCPNLKYFAYKADASCMFYKPSLDGFRGDSVVAFVKACPKLETLEMREVYEHVNKSHYVEIAEFVSERLDQYALRNMMVYGHSGVNVKDPFSICELLAEFTFLKVVGKSCQPRLKKGVMFWDIKYGTDGIPKRTRNFLSL